MLLVQTVQALLAHYRQAVDALSTAQPLTLEAGIELALALYRQVKVTGEVGADEEDDMLLFQYGTWNMGETVQGPYFGLDLTRQVTVEVQEEDPLLYQLRYEFQFDPEPFDGCPAYTSWSAEQGLSLSEWAAAQRATPGFVLARGLPFRAFNLLLDEV